MNAFNEETALLLRARDLAERLVPDQILALLTAAQDRRLVLTDRVGRDLQRFGCVAPSPGHIDDSNEYQIEPLGELVADIIALEGRSVPGMGKVILDETTLHSKAGLVFANWIGGRWIASSSLAAGEREILQAYFPELAWGRDRTTRVDLEHG